MLNPSNHHATPATLFLALLGADGDLAWRLGVPALYDLYRDGGLPERFAIVGVDRKPDASEALRAHYREGIEQFSRLGLGDAATWETFAARIDYRNPAFRCPGRRPEPVHARRSGGQRMGTTRSGCAILGRAAGRFSRLRRRFLGPGERRAPDQPPWPRLADAYPADAAAGMIGTLTTLEALRHVH